MGVLDGIRAKAFGLVEKAPGRVGDLARKANEALGRPLADEAELAERKAFAAPVVAAPLKRATAPVQDREPAPVVVYHMSKTRRDALRLIEILDGQGVPHTVIDIQEDPAAQMSVRRDSKGHRLPVVFIAGEVVGGRTELTNLATSGELKRKVFG